MGIFVLYYCNILGNSSFYIQNILLHLFFSCPVCNLHGSSLSHCSLDNIKIRLTKKQQNFYRMPQK